MRRWFTPGEGGQPGSPLNFAIHFENDRLSGGFGG